MRLLLMAQRATAVLVSTVALVVAAPGVAQAAGTEVYDGDFPDPYVLPVTASGSTTYWAYATGSAGLNLQVMKSESTDRGTWSKPADPLPRLPKWARPGRTWAPSVRAVGGKYVLYYTAWHAASDRQCIGRAVSSKGPLGPFSDSSTEPLVCQLQFGGSIDPDAFRDDDGRLYLHWKSDDNAVGGVAKLFGARLSADGLRLETSPAQLMKYDQTWETPLIEAPQMVHFSSDYHLFYSGNWWESEDAAVGYGKCSEPLATTCIKVTTDGPEGPGPWLIKDTVRVGVAGQTFFSKPSGGTLVAYHAWDDAVGYDQGGRRSLWMQSVSFATGSPVLGD